MTVFPVEAVGLLFVVPAAAGIVMVVIGGIDAVWSTVEARRRDRA